MAKTKKQEKTFASINEEIQAKEEELEALQKESREAIRALRKEITDLNDQARELKVECECKEFEAVSTNKVKCKSCGVIKTIG